MQKDFLDYNWGSENARNGTSLDLLHNYALAGAKSLAHFTILPLNASANKVMQEV